MDAELNFGGGPFVSRAGPLAHNALLRENIIRMHGAVLYDREKLLAVGGFDPSLERCEDYDVYLKITRQFRAASHGELVAQYRLHGQNMSSDTVSMLHWNELVLERHRPAPDDTTGLAAWNAGKRALPKAFANLAWKSRGGPGNQRFVERGKLMKITPKNSMIAAARQMAAKALPGKALNFARRVRQRLTARKTGTIDFGDLARLRPVDEYYGFGRGQPIDRYYIEQFLASNAGAVTGHVLEIGDSAYCERFGSNITRQDVLNSVPGHSATTIVGDLAVTDTLGCDQFDCIVATQTLQFIYDIKAAVAVLRQGLRPGGVVLATVPGISAMADEDWDWYWFLTEKSATRLFADEFGAENVEVSVDGNVFASSAFLYGVAVEDVGPQWLEPKDPAYPVIISIVARKPD